MDSDPNSINETSDPDRRMPLPGLRLDFLEGNVQKRSLCIRGEFTRKKVAVDSREMYKKRKVAVDLRGMQEQEGYSAESVLKGINRDLFNIRILEYGNISVGVLLY